jgi:hypothetical protein
MLFAIIISEVAVTRPSNKNLPGLSPTQAQIAVPIVKTAKLRATTKLTGAIRHGNASFK